MQSQMTIPVILVVIATILFLVVLVQQFRLGVLQNANDTLREDLETDAPLRQSLWRSRAHTQIARDHTEMLRHENLDLLEHSRETEGELRAANELAAHLAVRLNDSDAVRIELAKRVDYLETLSDQLRRTLEVHTQMRELCRVPMGGLN